MRALETVPGNGGPDAKLYHRAIIGDRLRDFALVAQFAMTAADVERILTWLASPEFEAICQHAELDGDRVKRKFHELIEEGNLRNVQQL